jgi:hypothetical protein
MSEFNLFFFFFAVIFANLETFSDDVLPSIKSTLVEIHILKINIFADFFFFLSDCYNSPVGDH